jgi:N-succinyldiaminopimelate aminotransferase
VTELLAEHAALVGKYPTTAGSASLRTTIARWLERRFTLTSVDADLQVLPLNGTREGLFALAQTVVTQGQPGAVISPNPFYQIYEGAALLAGSTPLFVNCDDRHGFTPDFSQITPDQWQACQLLYICTPGNPAGAVLSASQLQHLITLAQEYDFVIASDECYSEIYPNEEDPPPGLLEAAAEWVSRTIAIASASTVSRNDQIFPVCARDLSLETVAGSSGSAATELIMGAPCQRIIKSPVSGHGLTKSMW